MPCCSCPTTSGSDAALQAASLNPACRGQPAPCRRLEFEFEPATFRSLDNPLRLLSRAATQSKQNQQLPDPFTFCSALLPHSGFGTR